MRLLAPFLVVVVLCVGWSLFLEHKTDKFIKSLPEPPVSIEEDTTAASSEQSDVFSPEESSVLEKPDTFESVQKLTTSSHSHPHETPETAQEVITTADVTPDGDAKVSEKTPLPPLEGLKARLLKKHGDIPKVHEYIALRRKLLNREQLTMAESLTFSELLYHFNPTENNRRRLELKRRLSAVADPAYFRTDYDVDRTKRHKKTPEKATIEH